MGISKKTNLYILALLSLCIVFYGICALHNPCYLESIFFGGYETFDDFFKPSEWWHGDPYHENALYANYPALAMIIYRIIYRFMVAYDGMGAKGLWLVFLLYNVFCFWLVTVSVSKLVKLDDLNKAFLGIALGISWPVIWAVERGNLVNLAFALSIFFVAFHKEKGILRELSFIFLAIAAAIKIYPAIFGLLLFKEKKYCQSIRLFLYGIIIFIFPFTFYGIDSILIFIHNLQSVTDEFSDIYAYNFSLYNIIRTICLLFFHIEWAHYIYPVLLFTMSVGLIICFFISSNILIEVFCLDILLILFPRQSFAYVMIFLIIPFVILLSDYYESNPFKTVSSILMVLLFTPLPMPIIEEYSLFNYRLTYPFVIYYIIFLILSIIVIIEGIKSGINRIITAKTS